jgi:hypothetical protein
VEVHERHGVPWCRHVGTWTGQSGARAKHAQRLSLALSSGRGRSRSRNTLPSTTILCRDCYMLLCCPDIRPSKSILNFLFIHTSSTVIPFRPSSSTTPPPPNSAHTNPPNQPSQIKIKMCGTSTRVSQGGSIAILRPTRPLPHRTPTPDLILSFSNRLATRGTSVAVQGWSSSSSSTYHPSRSPSPSESESDAETAPPDDANHGWVVIQYVPPPPAHHKN